MLVFRSSLPAEIEQEAVSRDSRTGKTGHGESDHSFAPCGRKAATSKPPNGLVVSSDDEVGRKLAQNLGQCGLAPLFASTVVESRVALARCEVLVVLCNECLADGTYEDVVSLVCRSDTRIPLVVVSRTGEWPEYLRAVERGAFDYVAYPSISGDLQRAIRNALAWNRQNGEIAQATWLSPGRQKKCPENQ